MAAAEKPAVADGYGGAEAKNRRDDTTSSLQQGHFQTRSLSVLTASVARMHQQAVAVSGGSSSPSADQE